MNCWSSCLSRWDRLLTSNSPLASIMY
jgi:hypothetical protein